MANTLEYIFSLQDKVSAKIDKITITSDKMLDKFSVLQTKTNSVTQTFNETGRSIGSLREKIALLQAERDWLPAGNIEGMRAYNREIKSLNREVTRLESVSGGRFKKWSQDAFSSMPGASLIQNPLVAVGAIAGFAGLSAMNFDEGMAKVNITAQLDEKGLSGLSKQLKQVAIDNQTDISVAPVGLEKIISQVGDTETSIDILDAALKGSKGGFTSLDTVSGALAQTLSIVGKEKTNAREVLDVFFAAKRVGAGEFADFARYMPTLIAGADNMGVNFKEVAGVFAYMTGKGQSAEKAAVLMENAFSALGKSDIREKMEKAGVQVFDGEGKIRGMLDIFKDLQGVLGGLNDEQKSSMLEKFGLVDKEARSGFSVLMADTDKLREALLATADATGETDKALQFSENSMQKATDTWTRFKNIGSQLGDIALPVINIGLTVLSGVLDGVLLGITLVSEGFSWWMDRLESGNILVGAITGALTGATLALTAYYLTTKAYLITEAASSVLKGALWVKTTALTAAQWLLNTSLYACPLVWIVGILAVAGAAVYVLWQKMEGFRSVVLGSWEVIKEFGKSLYQSVAEPFKQLLGGIGGVCGALVSLVKGNFAEAKDAATKGFKDITGGMIGMNPINIGFNTFTKGSSSDAWETGVKKGKDSWTESLKRKEGKATGTPGAIIPESVVPETPAGLGSEAFEAMMKKIGDKNGKVKGGSAAKAKILDLNDSGKAGRLSAGYSAITEKLSPKVFMPALGKVAATVALPIAMATATSTPATTMPVPQRQSTEQTAEYGNEKPRVTVDRFCDQIVINVQNTDGKGVEEIRQTIINVLKEITEA